MTQGKASQWVEDYRMGHTDAILERLLIEPKDGTLVRLSADDLVVVLFSLIKKNLLEDAGRILAKRRQDLLPEHQLFFDRRLNLHQTNNRDLLKGVEELSLEEGGESDRFACLVVEAERARFLYTHYSTHDLDKALAYCRLSAIRNKEAGCRVPWIMSLANLSIIYEKKRDSSRRDYYLKKAVYLLEDLPIGELHLHVNRIRGMNAMVGGSLAQASKWLRRDLPHYEHLGSIRDRVIVQSHIADLSFLMGILDWLEESFLEMEEADILMSAESPIAKRIERHRADLEFLRGNCDLSLNLHDAQLKAFEDTHEIQALVAAYIKKLLFTGDIDRVRVLLLEYEELFRANGQFFEYLTFAVYQAHFYAATGQHDEALELLRDLERRGIARQKQTAAQISIIRAMINLELGLRAEAEAELRSAISPDYFFETVQALGILFRHGFPASMISHAWNSLTADKPIQSSWILTGIQDVTAQKPLDVGRFDRTQIAFFNQLFGPRVTWTRSPRGLNTGPARFTFAESTSRLTLHLDDSDRDVDLSRRPLMRDIMLVFVSATHRSLTIEDFYRRVWQVAYHPIHGRPKLLNSIKAFNALVQDQLLRVESDRIVLAKDTPFRVEWTPRSLSINSRQQYILRSYREYGEDALGTQDLASHHNCTQRTIQRDILRLKTLKLIPTELA